MMNREEVVALQHQRYATKKFDPARRISDEDWAALVEVGRLAPSSLGFEPWKMLLLNNKEMKQDLKSMAWGAVSMLDGASHFVIYLARKGVNYETPYIEKLMKEVRHRSYDPDSAYAHRIKSFQESDAKLNDERSLFDWASKQTYIQMTNMMNAAVLMGMDSCPIEGFDKDKLEAYLEEKGVLDTSEFGVSVMCAFGYRDEDIKPKVRWNIESIYEVID